MARIYSLIVLFNLLPLVAGCSKYVEDFHYTPHPVLADIAATQPQEPPPVSALVSIVGVRREDEKEGIPESVEIAMRLENNGPHTVVFDPQSMNLANGSVAIFRPPLARPPTPITLDPGQMAIISAYFPFPNDRSSDDTDLNWLQLRWLVQLDGRPVRQVANFQRTIHRYYYYEPYYAYPHVWYGGEVIVHRR